MKKMKIRFYLNTAAAATVDEADENTPEGRRRVKKAVDYFAEARNSPNFSSKSCNASIDGLLFNMDEHGIFTETNSFLLGVPQGIVEAELPIKLVTLYDEAPHGKPALGMYEWEGAWAIVDSFTNNAKFGKSPTSWRINVLGEEFDDVEQLYRRFRRGEIEPFECWTDLSPLERKNQELRAQVEKLQQQLAEATA